jgi:hypothetical protein
MLGLLAVFALPAALTAAPAAAPATKPAASAPAPKAAAPASLSTTIESLKALFAAGQSSDWDAATKQLAALKAAAKSLKHDVAKPAGEQKKRLDQLNSHIPEIEKAIAKKSSQSALEASNRALRVTQVLAATFANSVPQSVWQLQYLARELQVWSADPADTSKLKALPARIQAEWNKLAKDKKISENGDLASAFSTASTPLKSAAAPDDYAKAAPAILAALGKIESAAAQEP